MLEQRIVHLPKFSLRGGGFGGFRGELGMRVNLGEGHVAKHEAQAIAEPRTHARDDRMGQAAIPAFVVAVFEQRERRIRAAERMVIVAD
jgi:hypothetical protein